MRKRLASYTIASHHDSLSTTRGPKMQNPKTSLTTLAKSTTPWIIGVRHHSPALSAAMPHLLTQFAPDRILIELPTEFQDWLPWLGHPDTIAPIPLSAVTNDSHTLKVDPLS